MRRLHLLAVRWLPLAPPRVLHGADAGRRAPRLLPTVAMVRTGQDGGRRPGQAPAGAKVGEGKGDLALSMHGTVVT